MRILSTIFLVLTLIVGVGFFIYPDVASWWNGRIQYGLMDTYQGDVSQMLQDHINAEIQRAIDFNESLTEIEISDPFADISTLPEEYLETLNVRGIMATVEIPVVNVSLPVMHSTSSEVLDRGAGHLAGTSFPVGGENTHAVITAHSGLPNARMFTDLLDNQVYIGDYFFINVLDRRLAYRVIQIDTVEPHEVERIRLYPGEDFVTLITCTPFAHNTHRLLIRGTRVPYQLHMAEEIEPIISVIDTNWRLLTAFGAFLLFLVIFVCYQLVRILRGWLRKRAGLMPENTPVNPLDNDPYIHIPLSQRQSNPAYIAAGRSIRRRRSSGGKRKPDGIRRRLAMGMAIVILLLGATVALYPQVRRFMYDRYAVNVIEAWQDERYEARHFIQQRWINERTSFFTTIRDLPIGSTNGGMTIDDNGYITIGNINVGYVGQLSVGSDGYLTLAGQPLSSNGYLTLGDVTVAFNGGLQPSAEAGLYVSSDGNLYINATGNLYIGTNGGNLSFSNITLSPDGNLYIGNIPINNLVTTDWDYSEYNLDFIFNFDLDQDPLHWLNNQMVDYNHILHESEQEDLTCLEAAEEVDFSVTETAGFSEEILGFITIEAIDIRIPIFAGSSDGNMLRGAAHMTHTSLPVGGENTNAVITAHRGLTRARMFRDLDHLKNTNEVIQITNLYQTLRYQVFDYKIVDDVLDFNYRDPILIREGIDMITLLTCHPYRINNQRLLIFAERIPD